MSVTFAPETTEIQEAAHRGAEFLDEKRPGWENEIRVDHLAMMLPCQCILGQLTGLYDRGFQEIVNEGHSPYGERARELGFVASTDDDPDADTRRDELWDELQEAWIVEIHNRRS